MLTPLFEPVFQNISGGERILVSTMMFRNEPINEPYSPFATAKKGSAALEFAIIAPMMIFLLFGSVDLLDMLNTNKRVQNAASSVADVVARDTEVTNDEVAGFWAALDVLMFPDDGATVNMRVTSVTIVNASTARVVWSEGHGMGARVANSTVTLPKRHDDARRQRDHDRNNLYL